MIDFRKCDLCSTQAIYRLRSFILSFKENSGAQFEFTPNSNQKPVVCMKHKNSDEADKPIIESGVEIIKSRSGKKNMTLDRHDVYWELL
jgi:hypothetical protein